MPEFTAWADISNVLSDWGIDLVWKGCLNAIRYIEHMITIPLRGPFFLATTLSWAWSESRFLRRPFVPLEKYKRSVLRMLNKAWQKRIDKRKSNQVFWTRTMNNLLSSSRIKKWLVHVVKNWVLQGWSPKALPLFSLSNLLPNCLWKYWKK